MAVEWRGYAICTSSSEAMSSVHSGRDNDSATSAMNVHSSNLTTSNVRASTRVVDETQPAPSVANAFLCVARVLAPRELKHCNMLTMLIS